MTPDDRRGWVAFAFILWFGLAFTGTATLRFAAGLAFGWLIYSAAHKQIAKWRRRGEPDPLDNGGVVLDP